MGLLAALLFTGVLVARLDVKHPAGGFGHVVLAEELVVAIAALVLLGALLVLRTRLVRDRIHAVAVSLLIFEAISALCATNRWIAVRSAGLFFAGVSIFLVARAVRARTTPLLVPLALLATSVLLEASGAWAGLSRSAHAPGGLLAERNTAAALLVCGLPLVVASYFRGAPVLASTTGALTVAAIVCTRTRSAWLAAALLVVLGFALALRANARDRKRALVLVAVFAGAMALAPRFSVLKWASATPLLDTARHLVDPGTASGHGRLVQYATTWRMALANPWLGVGPGNWAGRYLEFAKRGDPTVGAGPWPTTRVPSSDLLGFLSEHGFLATLVGVLLLIALARGGRDAWLRRATIFTWLVVGTFDAVALLPPALFFLAWTLGSTAPQPTIGRRRASVAPPLVLVGALMVSAFFGVQRVRSFRIAVAPRGMSEAEEAIRLDPGDVALRLVVARDWIRSGRCDRAKPHLDVVHAHSPGSRMAEELDAECEGR